MDIKIKKVKIGNQNLSYFALGKGFPTIVILGWLASLEQFPFNKVFTKSTNNKFLNNNKIIFLHLSNFGKSSISKKPFTLNNYTDQLDNFIKHKKFKKVNLIGHSAGGRHVINYVIKHPRKVNKLILLATAGFTPKKPKQTQLERIKYYFYKLGSTSNEQKNILIETFKNLYNSDLRLSIKTIKTPTLVIWGKKDSTISYKKAYFFIKNIIGCKYIFYKNYGHMLTLKQIVWKKIFLFLNEV